MIDSATLLLRSLRTFNALSGRTELSAEEVNGLAATLGLSDAVVLQAVEQLKKGGFLEIHWGGRVSLTATGRGEAAGATGAGVNINLGAGASGTIGVVVDSPGAIVAVGGAAAGPGAVVLANVAGDLAALVQALRTPAADADKPTADAAKELVEAAEETLADLKAPAPEPGPLRRHAARLRGALARFGEAALKVEVVHEIVKLGHKILEALTPLM
jgi:hypothetical protein